MAKKGGEIRLNTDTGFLKLVAIVAMMIDHVGAAILPQYPVLRVIGRLAFPIFAYCLTVGCVYTRSMPRYILRVALIAVLVQPLYVVALRHESAAMNVLAAQPMTALNAARWYIATWHHPGIFVSLVFGLLVLWSLREERYVATAALLIALMWGWGYLDYGWKGIVLMVLFYLFRDRPLTSLVWVGGFMLWWGFSSGGSYAVGALRFSTQTFAVLALPLIYIPTNTGVRVNKWVFYLFYPAHLAVLLLLQRIPR